MRVTEIFHSIQGEGTRTGRPCIFIRFTGCDLRCGYCDSAYAFHGGEALSRDQILARLGEWPHTRYVTLTGGEPLLQRELPELAADLLRGGYEVAVETHGQRPIEGLPVGVSRIVDVKTPGSGEVDRELAHLGELRAGDEVKFVVCDQADFEWSAGVIRRYQLEKRVPVLLSPSWGQVDPRALVGWLLSSGLQARVSLQVHKYVWGPDEKGV